MFRLLETDFFHFFLQVGIIVSTREQEKNGIGPESCELAVAISEITGKVCPSLRRIFPEARSEVKMLRSTMIDESATLLAHSAKNYSRGPVIERFRIARPSFIER